MKRYFLISILLFSLSISSFAKKDVNAWKNEKNLKQQYLVFKENLNYWNSSYFLSERQLDEFYNSLTDSITVFENEISDKANQINVLQNELNASARELENTKAELEVSIKNKNTIDLFGENVEKRIYTFTVSTIILALFAVLSIFILLYKRSNHLTLRTQKEYNELMEEFEIHKKNSLDRYTKINMELHHTRLELNKK